MSIKPTHLTLLRDEAEDNTNNQRVSDFANLHDVTFLEA